MSHQEPIKVNEVWTAYKDAGLRFPAPAVKGVLDAQVAERVVVFDRDLEMTQHYVVARDEKHVTLGPAIPWREDPNYEYRTRTRPAGGPR